MVEVTIIQGKLGPDLKTFEAETEMPLIYRTLEEALDFVDQFLSHAKPLKIISSYWSTNLNTHVEYETVRVYRIEIGNKDIEVQGLVESIQADIEDDIE